MSSPSIQDQCAFSWHRLDNHLIQLALSFLEDERDFVCMQVGFRGDVDHIESYLHNMGYGPIKVPNSLRNCYRLANGSGYVVIESVNMVFNTEKGWVHGGEGMSCPVVYIARVDANPKWYTEEEELWQSSVQHVAPFPLVDNVPTSDVGKILKRWLTRKKSLGHKGSILMRLTRIFKNMVADGAKGQDEEGT